MNKLEFLKSIYDEQKVTPKNPDIYDQANVEVQMVLQLNKEKLVDYNVNLKDNAQEYYMANYRITDKGKQYVDEHKVFRVDNINKTIIIPIVITVIGSVITALILYWLGLK